MIDPDASRVLAAMRAAAKPMPDDQAEWLAGYRRQLAGLGRWQGTGPDLQSVTVTSPGGALRLLRPGGEAPWPTVLFLHGGGFVAGTLDAYDRPLRWLALRSGWQVATLDYRLAPEHRYPAAPDDCLAALRFLVAASHVRAGQLAVAGDSAGGLLAAATARNARSAGIGLRLQILLYPNADLRAGPLYPSREKFDGTVIRMEELYRSLDLYAGVASRADPALSPVLASDFSGLPPALVITNECDPLRDEGELLARRMAEAEVVVSHTRLPGMIHGVLQYAAAVPAGDALISQIAMALRRAATELRDGVAE